MASIANIVLYILIFSQCKGAILNAKSLHIHIHLGELMDGETDTEESSEAESDEADSVDFDDWEDSDEAGSDYADNSEAGSDNEDIIEKDDQKIKNKNKSAVDQLNRQNTISDVCGKVTCTDNNNQIIEYGSEWYDSYYATTEDDEKIPKKAKGEGEDYDINIYCCSPIQQIVSDKNQKKRIQRSRIQKKIPKLKGQENFHKVEALKNIAGKIMPVPKVK